MKKWYGSTNLAQRIFMFIVAFVVAFCGLGTGTEYRGSPLWFLLCIPLLLLIYLQLGATKKTEANGGQATTPTTDQ